MKYYLLVKSEKFSLKILTNTFIRIPWVQISKCVKEQGYILNLNDRGKYLIYITVVDEYGIIYYTDTVSCD